MLQFKDVAPQESSLKSLGTVASLAGVGGNYRLTSDKNFKSTKRVSISIFNAKGQRVMVNCSKPLSDNLRASSSSEELLQKIADLGALNILELPQFDEAGEPVMVTDEETGEIKQLTLYSISSNGAVDMSATAVTITEEMLKKDAAVRSINFEDLIAI